MRVFFLLPTNPKFTKQMMLSCRYVAGRVVCFVSPNRRRKQVTMPWRHLHEGVICFLKFG